MRKAWWEGRRRGELAVGFAFMVALLAPAPAAATEFAYVANDDIPGPIAGYAIGSDGNLNALPGSPYAGASAASSAVITQDGRYLYTADSPNNNGTIAAFAIGPTGALTQLPGSPYATAEGAPSTLALTPDGRFLYAADGDHTVDAYAVAPDGGLTAVPGSPEILPNGAAPCGAAVAPDGQHLYVAGSNFGLYAFSIGSAGTLTAVSGSPYTIGNGACATTVTPDGAHVYAVNVGSVSAFSVGAGGGLTEVTGSPFTASGGMGGDSDQAAISPDGSHLYVAGQDVVTKPTPVGGVSVFTIAGDGTLSEIAGSPFLAHNSTIAVALTPDGRHLYTGDFGPTVSGFSIGSGGGLTALSGSPFKPGGAAEWIGITPDHGPTAAFSRRVAPPGSAMAFNGTGSQDPDAAIVRYDWNFGDGTSAANAGATPSHSYRRPGRYPVTLTVTDAAGCSTHEIFTGQTALCDGGTKAQATEQVVVAANPSARISVPRGRLFVRGARVRTTFSCREGAFGPGLASCTDAGGRRSPHGTLDTRSVGRHSYRVSALSKDGQGGSITVRYAVRALTLSSLHAAPRSFLPGTSGPTIGGGGDSGTTLSYVDSFAARTTFRVLRCSGGGCTKLSPVGTFSHGDRMGANRLHFSGRVSGRGLAAGSYVIAATAKLAGQHSSTVKATFVVRLRPPICTDPDSDGDCDAPGEA